MIRIITLLTLIICKLIFSQEYQGTNTTRQEHNFWKKVQFGGGLGLNFGKNTTTISISPSAIYHLNEQFALGTGVGYLYSKRNNIQSNVFSLSGLVLYNVIPELQLSGEFEQNFVNHKHTNYQTNIPALYMGASYNIRENIALGLRYDILYDKNKSIYSSAFTPIIRVFF